MAGEVEDKSSNSVTDFIGSFYETAKEKVYQALPDSAKSFITELVESTAEDKVKIVDQYKSDRIKAQQYLPKVQQALSDASNTLEEFKIQPDSPERTKALQGFVERVIGLKQLEAQFTGLAQPRSVAQLLEKRLNTIVQAYDEKQETGVMPKWYTDRNYEDKEIGLMKKVQQAITNFKGAYQAQEILSSTNVDKMLGQPLQPNIEDLEVGKVASGVEWLMKNGIQRFTVPAMHLIMASPIMNLIPMSEKGLVDKVPDAKELIQKRDAAITTGNVDEASTLNNQIQALKLRTKGLESAKHLMLAADVLTSGTKEIRQFKDDVMISPKAIFDEFLFKRQGEEVPNYTSFKPVENWSKSLNVANEKDKKWVQEAGQLLGQIRDLPPIPSGEKTTKVTKTRGEETVEVLPGKSKQELLHQEIESVLDRMSTRTIIDNILKTDVTSLPGFIVDWAAQTPIFKAVQGTGKMLGSVDKVMAEEALVAGKALSKMKYGEQAVLTNKFDKAIKAINGEGSLLEIPEIQTLYSTFINKVEGAAGGKKDVANIAKDLRAETDTKYHQFIDRIIGAHKDAPESLSKIGQKQTQLVLTNIRDSVNIEAISTGTVIDKLEKLENITPAAARAKFSQTYTEMGMDIQKTANKLGIDISDIDFTKLADDNIYLKGMDHVAKSGKDKAIVEQILGTPEFKMSEGHKKVAREYLKFYEDLGHINKENGVVDLVYYGYSPRQIKESQDLLHAMTRNNKFPAAQIGKAVKYPTYGHMEEAYKKLGYELNQMSAEVAVGYANRTAANISVGKFRKFIEETQGLAPDKFPNGLKQLEKFIASGTMYQKDAGTKLWNKFVVTPFKRAILTGFPSTQVRNIADDAFRAALATEGNTLKAKSFKEAFHAYNGSPSERIILGPGHSYTGAELEQIMKMAGVTKSELIAGDGMMQSGVNLVKRKVAGPIQKAVRGAWEATPWAPELSQHTNNLQRANVFIQEMKKLLRGGKDFKEAVWEARNTVGKYLIDYANTSLATDFVAEYIPFYRFYGQSLNTYLDIAIQKPWALGRLNTFLFNSSFNTPTEEEKKYLSPYLKEMTLMTMGHDKLGNTQYLSQLGFSYEVINQLFSNQGIERNIEKWASQALPFQFIYGLISDRHPFFGTPYNSYMGRKANKLVFEMAERLPWFKKAVGGITPYPDGKDPAGKSLTRYEYDNPKQAYIMLGPVLTASSIAAYNVLKGLTGETVGAILSGQMSPRGLSTWSKLTEEDKTKTTKLLNYMTGLKIVSVDENANKLGFEMDKLAKQAKSLMDSQRALLDVQNKWIDPKDNAKLERSLKGIIGKTSKQLEQIEEE